MSDRTLSACSHKFAGTNCKKCGIHDFPLDPPIKTNYFDSYLNCSSYKYLKHMRKRQCKIFENKQINQSTYNLLQSICDKFEFTIETLALGIYIYSKIWQRKDKDEKFWASAALIVASKGIQLDKKVPYLNRYQRYADKNFTQQDYQLAEKTIFEELDFDLQYTTFVSFLHFYLTNGVLFKSDAFNPAILKYIEDDMIEKARDYIKTGEFLSYSPQKLALSIIKQIRVKFRLDSWNKQLQILSGFSQEQIEIISRNNILKPLNLSNNHNRQHHRTRAEKFSLNQISLGSLQLSLNLTQQKLKSGKRRMQSSVKFQNTVKLHNLNNNSCTNINNLTGSIAYNNSNQHLLGSNIKQNSNKEQSMSTLRSQVLSASKYGNGFMLSNSSQKIVPLNSFLSRRI